MRASKLGIKISNAHRHATFLCCLVAFVVTGSAWGADIVTPEHWPWRGITVNAQSFSQQERAELLRELPQLKQNLGANAIRAVLNPRTLAQRENLVPEVAWKMSLEWAEAVIEAANRAGLVTILALSEFPVDPGFSLREDSPEFWNSRRHLDDMISLTESLSEYFSGKGQGLVGYEILSEPLVREPGHVGTPTQWTSALRAIVDAVRKYDKRRWIVATPGLGGLPVSYRVFSPLNDPRIVYGAHMYVPHEFTHQGIGRRRLGATYPGVADGITWNKEALEHYLHDLRRFGDLHHVPIWIGEFAAVRWGRGAEQYLLDLAGIFDQYGWGWAYFKLGGYHGWNPDYDQKYSGDRPGEWSDHFVGRGSPRWGTLKKIF